MKKSMLVVYFSRTGYTRRIAEEIAGAAGADVEGVEEPRSRSGMLGYFRSAREALRGAPVEIRARKLDPRDYDLLVIGTPVWASHVCSPIRTYITAHRSDLPRVAFFCTEGGSGAAKVFDEMGALCGRAPLATLVLTDREVDGGSHVAKVEPFVRSLGAAKAA
jgi:flavodoxin